MCEPDSHAKKFRTVCLLCGKDIVGAMPPIASESVQVLACRDGEPDAIGLAHTACASGQTVHDMTGKPDYARCDEAAAPALPIEFDGDPKL